MAGKSTEKRKSDRVPSGAVGVWALLVDALQEDGGARPENSVTPDELAAKAHISNVHAGRLLRANKALRAVQYRANGRRCVCYVPVTA